jgi:hypothetical protein
MSNALNGVISTDPRYITDSKGYTHENDEITLDNVSIPGLLDEPEATEITPNKYDSRSEATTVICSDKQNRSDYKKYEDGADTKIDHFVYLSKKMEN